MSEAVEFTGVVEDVFGHRFTVAADGGKRLVDIGPHAEVAPSAGRRVAVKGEEKHGEVKAASLRLDDGEWTPVGKAAKDHGHEDGEAHPVSDADVDRALAEGGYTDAGGERRRKPRHVEVSARKDGAAYTVHVHKGGEIRKTEPAA